jgi:hypothetical protein
MLISGPDITLRKTLVFNSTLQYVLFIGKTYPKYPVLQLQFSVNVVPGEENIGKTIIGKDSLKVRYSRVGSV